MEALLEWRPNVLVSDLGMPEEDGLVLIRKVRALTPEQGGTVPAAALTAYARDEDRQQALSAGYHIYLSKPVDPEILATTISSLAQQN